MRDSARRLWTILRREYLVRVKNKWFLITTFGFPLLMLGLAFLPGLLMGTSAVEPMALGLVDRAGLQGADLPALLARQDSTLRAEYATPPEGEPGDLTVSLQASEFDAYLVLEPEVLEGESATLLAKEGVSQPRRREIRDAVREAVVRGSLREAGLSEEEAETVYRRAGVGLEVTRVGESAPGDQEVYAIVAFGLIFVLYMMFIFYGQMITRGVVEEKTSDVAEVLVSSVRPWELMAGKVLGIGAMGLTQIAIWAVAMAGVAVYGLAAGAAALAEAGIEVSVQPSIVARIGAVFLVFFLLGYFLYAAMFAAVGAVVGDESDVQQVSFFPMLLIIVPFLMAFTAIDLGTPDAGWMVGSSYFPFFTPILMLVRVTMGSVPAWEIAASIVLLVVATAGMAWLAGRIYRVGILMKGKRATLPEVVRWIRYG